MPRGQWDDDDVAAPPANFGRADDRGLDVVATLHENIRTKQHDKLERRVLLEHDDGIDTLERRQNVATLGDVTNWPLWALQATDRLVAVHADDERVSPPASAQQ